MSKQKIGSTEEDDLEEIRKGFEQFDVEGTGIINPSEILEAMDAMNMKEKNPVMYDIIEQINNEKEFKKKGGIKLDELVNYVYSKFNDTETQEGLNQIYELLTEGDKDNLSMSKFYDLARQYGDKISIDEIRFLLEKTQMGGEELTFDEFYTIMKGAKRSSDNNDIPNSNRSSVLNKKNDVYSKKGVGKKYITEPQLKEIENLKNEENLSDPHKLDGGEEDENKKIEVSNDGPIEYKQEQIKEEIINISSYDLNHNVTEEDIPNLTREDNKSEKKFEQQENQEQQSDTPLNYSYRKVHIGGVPKYEKTIEYNEMKEEEIEQDENYKKEKTTKVTELPDGSKEIEINEKTEIEVEKPIIQGNKYRYKKLNNEEKNEEVNSNRESKSTYYRIRRPRDNMQKSDDDDKSKGLSLKSGDDKNEIKIPKRYHRRYRDNKINSNSNEN